MGSSGESLPSGVVTFVFTDIEGSTKLLKRLPDLAPVLFDRHRELVRLAIREFGGHEVSTDGDAFFVAFDDVDDALAASATVQRLLADEPWPDGGEILVRIGVHVGVAVPRNDDYVALAVHQAARVVNAAHGGQIIVSDAVASAVGRPPPGRLQSLGRFRVRDFDEPEVLHRLDPDGLDPVGRAIRATPAEGHNIVKPATAFFGRGSVITDLADLVSTDRMLSIVGPGGIGKTRLATEFGLEQTAEWNDGVWLVELAEIETPGLVPSAFADALGVSPASNPDVWDSVLAWAADRQALLIVDNVESCLDVCVELLPELSRFAGIAVITTSREPLNVDAEVVYRLGPLDGPRPGDADELARYAPAVELFLDRARRTRPKLQVSSSEIGQVADLCERLDGLPLAIEIAAARVGVMSVAEILHGLDDRFALLRSNLRTLPERQRTLAGLLQWSHDLLSVDEQRAFRRLAVFGGSFRISAAVEALAADDLHADDVAELVWALVDKSMVVPDPSANGTRFRLLESVRDFATRLLAECSEELEVARRAADDLLDRVGPWQPSGRRLIGEVGIEIDNIRSLIHRLGADGLGSGDHEAAQSLAVTLGRYHDAVQTFQTGIRDLDGITRRPVAPTPARVVLLTTLADLHLRRNEIEEAIVLVDEAAAAAAIGGSPAWSDVAVERTRGEILSRQGDHDSAAELAREALARPDLSVSGRARMNNLLGISRHFTGDLDGAVDALRLELEAHVELGDDAKIATAHANLAETALQLGDRRTAAFHQQASLELALEIGQPVMIAYSSIVAARLAAGSGDWELAVRLLGAGERTLELAGIRLYDADQVVVEELRRGAVGSLGTGRAAAISDEGAALGVIDAAQLATDVFQAALTDSSRRPDTTRVAP